MAAISSVTFAAGRMPPLPGFAPWLSFTSKARTCGWRPPSSIFAQSIAPSGLRTPYFAGPIWKMTSLPPER